MASERQAAFEASLLRHLDAAHNLARWLVRDASVAEDVMREAVLRACRYFPLMPNGEEKVWLLRNVHNVAHDYVTCERRPSFGISLNAALDDASARIDSSDTRADAESAPLHRQQPVSLGEAIEALPIPVRACLILREVEALSYGQIARITNIPIGTVLCMLCRARQFLARSARSPMRSTTITRCDGATTARLPART
jgi:RNA polymerase sigma-70 factor (ECF subfamily)